MHAKLWKPRIIDFDMQCFLDTNIFLRVLMRDIEDQYQASLEVTKAVRSNKIDGFTSQLVLAETVWTLSSYYKFPKKMVVRGIHSIIQLSGLTLEDRTDMQLALTLFEANNVKYIDCMIAAMPPMQRKEWIIISYDHDFDKLGVIRKEPLEIIKKIQNKYVS